MLEIRPITYSAAMEYIKMHHRHHGVTAGQKFAIAAYVDDVMCGVAVCCRPVSRMLDDGKTLEVARLCTDGTKNACSKLYGACARIAKDMGYKKVITYILESESGTSLRASGWILEDERCGGYSWNKPSRKREDKAPLERKKKMGENVCMSDLIDRERLNETIKDFMCSGCNNYHGIKCRACFVDDCLEIIEDVPTVKADPVVEARWESRTGIMAAFCSHCGGSASFDYPRCPWCGAHMMRGEKE